MLGFGPRLKTVASQHFVRSLGCCGRDILAVSLSALDPACREQVTDFGGTGARALIDGTMDECRIETDIENK